MANGIITLRVLQQDTEDQIRIGAGFPALEGNIDKVVENTIKQYGKEMEWWRFPGWMQALL